MHWIFLIFFLFFSFVKPVGLGFYTLKDRGCLKVDASLTGDEFREAILENIVRSSYSENEDSSEKKYVNRMGFTVTYKYRDHISHFAKESFLKFVGSKNEFQHELDKYSGRTILFLFVYLSSSSDTTESAFKKNLYLFCIYLCSSKHRPDLYKYNIKVIPFNDLSLEKLRCPDLSLKFYSSLNIASCCMNMFYDIYQDSILNKSAPQEKIFYKRARGVKRKRNKANFLQIKKQEIENPLNQSCQLKTTMNLLDDQSKLKVINDPLPSLDNRKICNFENSILDESFSSQESLVEGPSFGASSLGEVNHDSDDILFKKQDLYLLPNFESNQSRIF